MDRINLMKSQVLELCSHFNTEGSYVSHKVVSNGHINSTFVVQFENEGKRKGYILQKINKYVFKKPNEVMENISNATNFIKDKLRKNGLKTSKRVMSFLKSNNGNYYHVDNNGDYWRMSKFIDNSITFNKTDDLFVLEETGKAFGDFQNLLSDFPIEKLNITIPHFHNTINRYEIFEDAIEKDYANRVSNCLEEIEQYRNLKCVATKMYKMQKKGLLSLRVTHNDTKCNNVLYDADTKHYLCAIDLDTVMPGLVGFDFGDAIRFGANSCDEDEEDLSKVYLDLNKFSAFTKGFLSKTNNSLTQTEINTLSLGAITMTIECGLRFLTDYIEGDNYFKIDYCDQNLNRAKCQLALAKDMLNKYQQMNEIVENYSKHFETYKEC